MSVLIVTQQTFSHFFLYIKFEYLIVVVVVFAVVVVVFVVVAIVAT